MALTRASLVGVLASRTAGWTDEIGGRFAESLANAGIGYDDPIAFALRQCSVMPADPFKPVDGDLAGVSVLDIDKVLDFAEFRLLATALQNYVDVDVTIGPRHESADQMRKRLQEAVEARRAFLQRTYGYGAESTGDAAALSAGTISLDFQEQP
jgi:hypothetical protein